MTTQRATRHKDSGAALLLAIGFVVLIGAIGGAMVAVVNAAVTNRAVLEAVRDREYSADAAIQDAITEMRGASCSPPTAGSFGPGAETLNKTPIRVDWQTSCGFVTTSGGSSYEQRNVIFSACVETGAPPCAEDAVIIRAQVNFEPASGPVAKTFVQAWSVNR